MRRASSLLEQMVRSKAYGAETCFPERGDGKRLLLPNARFPVTEDFQEWSRDEGKVRLVRDQGNGEATKYMLGD